MNIFYVDYDTGVRYNTADDVVKAIPGINRQFLNKMQALIHLPYFVEFVNKTRRGYKIPAKGYSYKKVIEIMSDDEGIWSSVQAAASNEFQATRWGEHYDGIATIILGNFIPLHEYSGKAIFLEEVKLANVNNSLTFPAMVINPNRKVTLNDLRAFIKSNAKSIEKLIKTKDKKDFKPDAMSLEIWELSQRRPKLKYSEIADIVNKKYNLGVRSTKYQGSENVSKTIAKMKNQYDYYLENPYF